MSTPSGARCLKWDECTRLTNERCRLSVIEIWGVAARLTKRPYATGIHSILDLSRADTVAIRDKFSIVMMRTVLEL